MWRRWSESRRDATTIHAQTISRPPVPDPWPLIQRSIMTEETKAPAPSGDRPSRPFGERSGGGDRPRFGGGGGGGPSGPRGSPRASGRTFFLRKKRFQFLSPKISGHNYQD